MKLYGRLLRRETDGNPSQVYSNIPRAYCLASRCRVGSWKGARLHRTNETPFFLAVLAECQPTALHLSIDVSHFGFSGLREVFQLDTVSDLHIQFVLDGYWSKRNFGFTRTMVSPTSHLSAMCQLTYNVFSWRDLSDSLRLVPLRLLIVELAYSHEEDTLYLSEDDDSSKIRPSIRLALASMNIDAYANQFIAEGSPLKFLFIHFTNEEQPGSSWKVTTTDLQRLRDWESVLALEGSPLEMP